MRIAHFVHSFPPEYMGGTESYVLNLALRQLRMGYRVLVVAGSLRDDSPLPRSRQRFRSVEILRLYKQPGDGPYKIRPHYPRMSREVKAALRAWSPDLVHLHHWHHLTDDIARIAAAERIPVVMTLHDLFSVCPRFFRIRPGRMGICPGGQSLDECFDCIHSQHAIPPEELTRDLEIRRDDMARELEAASVLYTFSRSVADFFGEIPGLPALPIQVLPMGLLRPLTAAEPPADPRPLKVATWGGHVEVKGTHLLLEAACDPLLKGKIEVHILGKVIEPSYRERLESLAAACGARFHGVFSEPEKESLGRRFDLAVFPTQAFETYSIVVDEALALGLPVVTTYPGAQSERIGDAGTLVPAGDVQALARAIGQHLDPEFRRVKLEAAKRIRVGTMDQHWLRLHEIYRELTQPGRGRRARLLGPPYCGTRGFVPGAARPELHALRSLFRLPRR